MHPFFSRLVKIVLFFSPTLLFIGYNLFVTYSPIGAIKTYSITARSSVVETTGGVSLYDSDSLNLSGTDAFRVQEPLFMELARLPRIDGSTTFSAEFDNDDTQELYISLFRTDRYDDPYQKEEFSWYPVTFPDYDVLMTNDFGKVYVHKKAKLTTLAHPETQDFVTVLSEYASDGSTLGMYPGIQLNLTNFTKIPAPKAENMTSLPWHIRGDVGLYAYIQENSIRLTFTKIDLNSYNGEDTYTLNVFKEGSLIYTKKFADDGFSDQLRSNSPQDFSFQLENIEPGLYKFELISNRTDNERLITSDTTIQNITLNAPYVITDGKDVQFAEATTVYTRKNAYNIAFINDPRDRYLYPVGYNAEHTDTNITITPDVDDFTVITLTGEKKITGMFSHEKGSYFEPYSIIPSQISPDFWIVPHDLVFTPSLIKPYIKRGTVGLGIREAFPIVNTPNAPHDLRSILLTVTTESLFQ